MITDSISISAGAIAGTPIQGKYLSQSTLALIEPIAKSDLGKKLYDCWAAILDARPEFTQWLIEVGGLGMTNINDEHALVRAGIDSPGPLALGLVHGRVADMLAFGYKKPNAAHSFVTQPKLRSAEQSDHLHALLALGFHHIESAEAFHDDFLNEMTLAHSRETGATLIEQAVKAPTNFLLGQLTSWLVIHLQMHGENSLWDAGDWVKAQTVNTVNTIKQ